ncbi:maleylpyruvate isomerase family mycothiol-dependent enzyme [Actinoplanes sp. NPDC026619]|uniref:maleylpyruvate isomerase family mycothiol-dependent enzyme n=1 Tax=Actinoplanes sp. NPDC026619 TaxID=3155798 RepID=UPI0033F4F710
MEWLPAERYAAEMIAETDRLGAAVTSRPADAIVPDCPEWTTRDLVTHVGTGHRFAAGAIEQRCDRRPDYVRIEAPGDQGEWAGWLAAGARRLNAAVDDFGFGAELWTWRPQHQTAGFWQRRMLHDLIIHRLDGEGGEAGAASADLAPEVAADGIADLLLTFEMFPQLTGAGETLRLSATDTGDSWQVTLTPDGLRWQPGGEKADVTVAAPVAELLLILNRRRAATDVEGDTALFERFREGARF